ncbi:AAA family ATPase [Candidatus Woesearchaeota archaeon]|nr:AAA family ATPase [Candidatus Woesearchaeota archaeon]
MGAFNGMLKGGESLVKNELALDYSYIPKLIPYREGQMRTIAAAIKPLFQKRNGRNMFIYGLPGVGKTVAVKHILKEIEEESEDVTPFYINCWQKNTAFKILTEMCDVVGYKLVQNKRTEELFDIVKQYVNKSERSAVFVFDEVDKIEDFDFIYSVLEDVFRKSVVLITNYKEFIAELDERIKSRLTAEMLEFQPYNLSETRGVLKQRMDYAFVQGVWEDDAFEAVVQKTAKMSDIRTGLYMMKEAALVAEERSSRKITAADVSVAMKKLDDFSIKKAEELEEEVKLILGIIKENSGKKIGDLYRAYQESGGKMVYKTFQRKISKLEEDRFITTKKIEGGKEGKTTIISYGKEKKLTEF